MPLSAVHRLTEPVRTKSAPRTKAAAADSGAPMPPCGADPHGPGDSPELRAQSAQRGQQRPQRRQVRVVAGVADRADVVRQRDALADRRLLGGEQPLRHQLPGERGGRRREEQARRVRAGHLGQQPAGHVDGAVRPRPGPGEAVPHQRGRHLHVRGGLHEPDVVPDQQVDQLVLRSRVERVVGDVDAERRAGRGEVPDPGHGRAHLGRGSPAAPKKESRPARAIRATRSTEPMPRRIPPAA